MEVVTLKTNEEKAKRTYPYFEDMNDIEIVQTNAKRIGFIAGCEWKDEQFAKEKQALIDKACEWWESELTYPTMTRTEIDLILGRIKDFKQEMKGEDDNE